MSDVAAEAGRSADQALEEQKRNFTNAIQRRYAEDLQERRYQARGKEDTFKDIREEKPAETIQTDTPADRYQGLELAGADSGFSYEDIKWQETAENSKASMPEMREEGMTGPDAGELTIDKSEGKLSTGNSARKNQGTEHKDISELLQVSEGSLPKSEGLISVKDMAQSIAEKTKDTGTAKGKAKEILEQVGKGAAKAAKNVTVGAAGVGKTVGSAALLSNPWTATIYVVALAARKAMREERARSGEMALTVSGEKVKAAGDAAGRAR